MLCWWCMLSNSDGNNTNCKTVVFTHYYSAIKQLIKQPFKHPLSSFNIGYAFISLFQYCIYYYTTFTFREISLKRNFITNKYNIWILRQTVAINVHCDHITGFNWCFFVDGVISCSFCLNEFYLAKYLIMSHIFRWSD